MRAFFHRVSVVARPVRDVFVRSAAMRWLTVCSFVLVILTAALPWWRVVPNISAGTFVPLHANIYFGIDQFGPWWKLFVPALLGFVTLVINTVIGANCFRQERLLTWFFLGLTLFVEIILLVASAFMVLLNI